MKHLKEMMPILIAEYKELAASCYIEDDFIIFRGPKNAVDGEYEIVKTPERRG